MSRATREAQGSVQTTPRESELDWITKSCREALRVPYRERTLARLTQIMDKLKPDLKSKE